MTDNPRSPEIKFAFMGMGFDPVGEHKFFSFDVSGSAPAYAIINLKSAKDQQNGDRNVLAIMPHEVQGQFNVLACRAEGKSIAYSFTHIEDVLQLGEHLRALGVSEKVIATFNQLSPEQAVPVRNPALMHEATADLARIMKGAAGHKGPSASGG